jgi:hypothetical protein
MTPANPRPTAARPAAGAPRNPARPHQPDDARRTLELGEEALRVLFGFNYGNWSGPLV